MVLGWAYYHSMEYYCTMAALFCQYTFRIIRGFQSLVFLCQNARTPGFPRAAPGLSPYADSEFPSSIFRRKYLSFSEFPLKFPDFPGSFPSRSPFSGTRKPPLPPGTGSLPPAPASVRMPEGASRPGRSPALPLHKKCALRTGGRILHYQREEYPKLLTSASSFCPALQ